MASVSRTARLAAVLPIAAFLIVYLPRVGHGFILDDYRWVHESRVESVRDLGSLLVADNGFYRPVVSLSFAVNRWWSGLEPLGYGLTNLLLVALSGGLIYQLARRLALPWGAAAFASGLFLLSPHGTAAALLWTSGRTSLLATTAALAAALALHHRAFVTAAVAVGVAVFAKEEALPVPFVLAAWLWWDGAQPRDRARDIARWALVSVPVVVVYLFARAEAGAMTFADAPGHYQLTFDAARLVRNLLEYADRTLTLPVVALLISGVILRPSVREFTVSFAERQRVVWLGVVWLVGGFGLTVALPARSSLYACLPSVGACLASGAIGAAAWSAASSPRRRMHAVVASMLAAVAVGAVLYTRSTTMVTQAEASQRLWESLPPLVADLREQARVRVVDDTAARFGARAVFGNFLADAYALQTGRALHFRVEPVDGDEPWCASCAERTLVVRDGQFFVER